MENDEEVDNYDDEDNQLNHSTVWRNGIAEQMWIDYQAYRNQEIV
jgi:hypothetical protein